MRQHDEEDGATVLNVEALPAAHGDCLLVEYEGDDAVRRRILVDGGPHSTYASLRTRILELPPDQREFELLVVTHIDADHIDGIIILLQDTELGATFKDIWFNGWKQIENFSLGAPGGEFLGALLEDGGLVWNEAWDGEAVVVPDAPAPLPQKTLDGGATLTLLSPGPEQLADLRKEWVRALRAGDYPKPGDTKKMLKKLKERKTLRPKALGDSDDSEANGSSIAFLLEVGDHSALLVGDAFADVLEVNIRRLMRERGSRAKRFRVDLFKLPHHGSKKNMQYSLAALIDAKHIVVSTSGAIFGHPDKDTLDQLIMLKGQYRPNLVFNYRSSFNDAFADADDQKTRRYDASYPAGNRVELT